MIELKLRYRAELTRKVRDWLNQYPSGHVNVRGFRDDNTMSGYVTFTINKLGSLEVKNGAGDLVDSPTIAIESFKPEFTTFWAEFYPT